MKADQQDSAPNDGAPLPGDAHTRDRWRWLDQVMADHDLKPFAFSVAYVVASFVNRETGEAWPSQATIADRIRSSDRWVRKAVDQLVDRGHLNITTPEGRKGGNHYRLILKVAAEVIDIHRNGSSGKGEFHRNGGSHESADHRNYSSGNGADHRNGSSGKGEFHRNGGADFIGTTVPPIPMIDPFDSISPSQAAPMESKPSSKPRKTRVKSDDPGFIAAYELYPRHDAPDAAKRAYAAAIGRGAKPEEIMAGVQRYADQRRGKDETYTAMMATWLNAGRWKDGQSTNAGAPQGSSAIAFEVRGVPVTSARALEFVVAWKAGGPWHTPWGPAPDEPGCVVPRQILEQAGVTAASAVP